VSGVSTKPYLIRAIHEWCTDNGLTPYLAVKVDANTRVPLPFVKDGEIVLNIGVEAVRNLQLGNDEITCGGRFGGVSHEIWVPVGAVLGIYAKENGQGLVFQPSEPTPPQDAPPADAAPHNKPHLRVVK
jgi:stringent starvation protein B